MLQKYLEHVEKRNKRPVKDTRSYSEISDEMENELKERVSRRNVRVVAYFNPKMFADQRNRSRRWLEKLENFQIDLNRRLLSPSNSRGRDSIIAEIDRFIRRKDLINCFEVSVERQCIGKKNPWQVSIRRNEELWKKKQQYDGFCILVSYIDCKLTASQICTLYREKDVVEKDFQTIKSILKLRPIRHYIDYKVNAHVTICMLSLFIERKLKEIIGEEISAKKALELLKTCYLNQFDLDDNSFYSITSLSADQKKLLKKINMTYLGDDDYLTERIKTP